MFDEDSKEESAMSQELVDTSRLDASGWTSFRPELFLDEPGRKHRDEGDAFLRLLRDYSRGPRVLELCSGSGKLVIHLARNGFDVVGLDLSQEMLEICRRQVAEEVRHVQERIRLVQGDMCTFDLKQTFDFVILEDDGFGYLLTQEDQISCLRRICQHLSDEGYFFLSNNTPDRELAFSAPYEYDPVLQIMTTECRWDVADEKGTQATIREGFERRKLTYPCELELLLCIAGLRVEHRWGDSERRPFVDPSTQEYNYLIRKIV